MKKILSILTIPILLLYLVSSCKSSKNTSDSSFMTAENSQNSLDWDGIYRGTIPCADCEGIKTTLYINRNLTYKLVQEYLGKAENPFEYTGKFKWNREGNIITLSGLKDMPDQYQVGEDIVTQLDMSGKKIEGNLAVNYTLSKPAYTILEKYWKLVELNGQSVIVDSTFAREPHIIFKDSDNRVIGNGGCNSFFAQYEISGFDRLHIKAGGRTMMACPNLPIEDRFMQVLEMADSFIISGDELILHKARMAPLARFKTVYME
jgi:copper homeostasis protein (lipoprotein)